MSRGPRSIATTTSTAASAKPLWKIEGPAKEDSLLDLRFDLELGPGLRTLAVAVRDELSRETSFVSTTLAVPTPQPPVAAQSSR